ncbi:MAG: hypothetical protein WB792_05470 [Desulfobacterales bacterium]
MDIVIGRIQPAKEERSGKKSFRKHGEKAFFKERRKNKEDRRQGIRDGVIVSLSTKNDRREQPDRRRRKFKKNPYTI